MLQIQLNEIDDIINHLFQLAPSLKDPIPHDSRIRDVPSSAANFDLYHIEMKFPDAKKDLVARLGRAAWNRRQDLMSLSTLQWDSPTSPKADEDASQSASSAHQHYRHNSSSSDFPGKATFDRTKRKSHGSETATDFQGIATSTMSGTPSSKPTLLTSVTPPSPKPSRATSDIEPKELSEKRRLLPRPPEPNQYFSGESFLCPYCSHKMVNIKNPKVWKYASKPLICFL